MQAVLRCAKWCELYYWFDGSLTYEQMSELAANAPVDSIETELPKAFAPWGRVSSVPFLHLHLPEKC